MELGEDNQRQDLMLAALAQISQTLNLNRR